MSATRTRRAALRWIGFALVVATALVAGRISTAHAGPAPGTYTGTLPDGAKYVIDVPTAWNGTLVLYSHGYVVPGSSNPAQDAGDPVTKAWLLGHGYALAGSSFA